MKLYLSFSFLFLQGNVYAQQNTYSRDSTKLFNNDGNHHTLEVKGLFIIYPIGNGHMVSSIGGLGIRLLKRHHVGFDVSYTTGIDRSDDVIDTLGIEHSSGKESHSKSNGYAIYYHYHFNLFRLNEKSDLNFFIGSYYRYRKEFDTIDPLYRAEYITQKGTNHTLGLTTGIAIMIKDVKGLRIETGMGAGRLTSTDDIKFRKDNMIMYKTEKASYVAFRFELGMYWTFL